MHTQDVNYIDIEKLNFVPAFLGVRKHGLIGGYGFSGLYAIKENGVIVYIGMSKICVHKALYRHFQKWGPDRTGKHYRVCYKNFLNKFNYTVTLIEINPLKIEKIEKNTILYYGPRDNEKFHTSAGHIELQSEWNDKDLPF